MTRSDKIKDLAVGQELPPFTRTTGLENWNRYAAVNDEFVPIHMDDAAGREAGYPSAFGMGNLQWAYLHNVLRDWMGDSGEIRSLSCQFRAPNLKEQTVSARARVTAIEDGADSTIVDLEVWTEDETGSPLAPGRARVVFPSQG